MKTTKTPIFFRDKPLLGLDIGHGSLKVMQVEPVPTDAKPGTKPRVTGYGFTTFDTKAQKDGVIIDPKIIADAMDKLFKDQIVGSITTKRAALAIPAYRTFTRTISLPQLKASEVEAAVRLEAEQYIPLPLDALYLDYEIIRRGKGSEATDEIFMVAVPQDIVDSYLELAELLDLEAIIIEPTLESSSRLFELDKHNDEATFIIDFGSLSSDISIFDGHIIATGTVQGGGVNFTTSIKNELKVSETEAGLIKTRHGLASSKYRDRITSALEPTLQQIMREIRRMMRYYEERYGSDNRPVGQIVTLGGGANMPGLSEYLTQALRLPVRHTDPWNYLDYKGLQPPSSADRPMYTTVAGLALANPKEVFRK